jgi:hypothetical protein
MLDLESDVSPSAAIALPLMLDTQSDVSPSDVCKLETLILSWHFIIIFRVCSVLQGTLNPGPLHAVQQPVAI